MKRRKFIHLVNRLLMRKPKRTATLKFTNKRRKRNRVAHISRMKNK